jgi:ankyrin repeat protein
VALSGGQYGTALEAACSSRNLDIITFNIHERILNDPGGKYGTPLQVASSVDKTDIVKLLLQNHAD